MATILEETTRLEARMRDPRPIAADVEQVLRDGNRIHLLAAVDVHGRHYDPPKPATIRSRGPGTVMVPKDTASVLITRYEVLVELEPGEAIFTAGWPGLDWVHYHVTGTSRMVARDPTGFRAEDLDKTMRLLRSYIMEH